MPAVNDNVSEFLTKSKIRFKTHKLRNAFIAEIISLVRKSVNEENACAIVPKQAEPIIDIHKNAVHQIMPNKKPVYETVMTKQLSEKGDDLHTGALVKK